MTEYTTPKNAITPRDFEELRGDVSQSPLWNQDLAPTTLRERTWSTWNIAAMWISASAFSTGVFATRSMLGGNFIQQGMNWWQATLTVLVGNCLVVIPMVLNAHAGTKYGVSFPVLCRASFGTKGANIPAILRAIVACVWFSILTVVGGVYLDALLSAIWSGWSSLLGQTSLMNISFHTWVAFLLFWLIQVFIILKGIEGIKNLETWSAPLLLACGIMLLVWASWRAGGLGRALTESSALQAEHNSFWHIFPRAVATSFGYWAVLSLNIPDFTRYARSQRSQILGQVFALPLAMTAFVFISVVATSASLLIYKVALAPTVTLTVTFRGATAIIFAMLVILAAQLAANMAANVVASANVFSNLYPKRISFVMGGLITALIGIMMIPVMPLKLLNSIGEHISTWLIGYSGWIGAIAGILICDYWVLRKRQLSLADLFETAGIYSYSRGINWRAVITLCVAIAPVVPGFLRAAAAPEGKVTNPNFFDTLHTYAWFITFGIGFVVYYVLMKGRIRRE